MARTFRRRGEKAPKYCFREHEYKVEFDETLGRHRFVTYVILLEGKEAQKAEAFYHADGTAGSRWMRSEPRWWRNMYERKNRANTRQLINRFVTGIEDDVLPNTRSNNRPRKDYWW